MKVSYIDHMGTDLSIVNAARVSFGKRSKWEMVEIDNGFETAYRLQDADKRLIQFLARGCTSGDWEKLIDEATGIGVGIERSDCLETEQDMAYLLNHIRKMPDHWTPFGHTAVTLHIKAPLFVARQLGKHQTGLVWNEVSRRYVTDEPEFYHPGEGTWRRAAKNVKQGSTLDIISLPEGLYGDDEVDDHNRECLRLYNRMLDAGVCPEQARMVLPQSMYTEWYWTGNLYAFANVFTQRTDNHTQRETQEVAKQIGEIIEPLFPVSWEALTS